MAGPIRLFQKDRDGLLHEVPPGQADALRATGTVSHANMTIDILWTDAELLQRAADEAATAVASTNLTTAKEAARMVAVSKLNALGLTVDDFKALLA